MEYQKFIPEGWQNTTEELNKNLIKKAFEKRSSFTRSCKEL